MLSEGNDIDARQRWTSSLMNLHGLSSASATGNSQLYNHATYQPSMTAYTNCSRPIQDLAGYTSAAATAELSGGYRYAAAATGYDMIAAGGLHTSSDQFRLPHDIWGQSVTACSGTSLYYLRQGGYVINLFVFSQQDYTKLLNRFTQISVELWHMCHGRTH